MTKAARTVLVPASLYRAIKYTIYLLLAINIGAFLFTEWQAARLTFRDGVDAGEVVEAFTATIDTAAWVMLLLLFELETFVIPDAALRGRLRWALHGVRAFCYLFIVYAFYGYVLDCLGLYRATPLDISDPCTLAGTGAALMTGLNEFEALTAGNCPVLAGAAAWQLDQGASISLASVETLDAARKLAWTDAINAGNWLLIVLLLEIDVRLQLAGHLRGRLLRVSEFAKTLLYSILLVCALYWGWAGTFLDFWDALLWLLAFGLIEMNVLEWQAEGITVSRSS